MPTSTEWLSIMQRNINFLVVSLLLTLIPTSTKAEIFPLDVPNSYSYYFVDHFEIVIDKPLKDVWPHVLAMGSWIPAMAGGDLNPSSFSEGDIFNIYGNFNVEITKVIPENMILMINMPTSDKGERTQGVAMITTTETRGKTLVSLFMSRIYFWFTTDNNPQRITRETENFSVNRKSSYKDNFLTKLKEIAES